MTDDERAALQRKIATEIRHAMTHVRANGLLGIPLPSLADIMIANCETPGPDRSAPAAWASVVAVVLLDDRLRDGLAQVMQAAIMLDELARATELREPRLG